MLHYTARKGVGSKYVEVQRAQLMDETEDDLLMTSNCCHLPCLNVLHAVPYRVLCDTTTTTLAFLT